MALGAPINGIEGLHLLVSYNQGAENSLNRTKFFPNQALPDSGMNEEASEASE